MEGKDKEYNSLKEIDDIITLKLAKDLNINNDKTPNEGKLIGEKIRGMNYKKNKMIGSLIKKISIIKNIFSSSDNDAIEQIHKKLIPIPKHVTIDLTNSCNLNCIGCWTHSPLLKDKAASNEWKSQSIPFETLKNLINDLYDLGTERIRLTGGGEPLLYPRIFEVISLIKKRGMICDITTNFTLLNKQKIKRLFKLNVDEIVLSIWAGDAETYIKIHPNQTKETFERIKENLILIAQSKEKFRKEPKIIMANVLFKYNYNKVKEMAKFATEVLLDEIYFTLLDPIKERTDCLLLNKEERKILLRELNHVEEVIKDYNRESKIHKINIVNIRRFIKRIIGKGAKEGKYDIDVINKPCYIGYIFARIMANGDVAPCCRAVMYPMGNINKESFKDIWFSEKYDKFRKRALYENKLNPYFKKIGCYMMCDNQVHNKELEEFMGVAKNLKIKNNRSYDFILIVCPPWGLFCPPLGPNYLSSFLASNGYKTKILDLNISLYNKNKHMNKYWTYDFKDRWLDDLYFKELYDKFSEEIEKFISQIIDSKCKLIGFSAYQNNIKMILKIASEIKRLDSTIKIIVGGPSCSIERERKIFYKPFIDFIVVGEGEETLCELLEGIKMRQPLNKLSKIPGLVVTSVHKNQKFTKRKPLDVKKMSNYKNNRDIVKEYGNHQIVSIFMSKGCIGNCTFCNDKHLMGKYRVRPAEQIISEIKYYVKNNISSFSFNDLLINGDIKQLKKLCDFIIKDNLQISWTANAIASENLTLNMIKKIKKSGCRVLIFGIESGSDRVLKSMRKPIRISNVKKVLSNCKKVGIETWVNFIVGYPTETKQDFYMTLRFIENNNKNIDKILCANTCAVLHNSDLMLNREKYGIKLSENDKIDAIIWDIKDGKNTWKIREERLKILLKKAKYLEVPVEQTNLKLFDDYRKKGMI